MPKASPTRPAAPDYEQLFRLNPEPSIVLTCDDPAFTIVAQNQAHARLTNTIPKTVVGRSIFATFPDTSEKFRTTGVSDLLESFRTVVRTRQPHNMEALRYDIKDKTGKMAERYWRATHYPLLAADGTVAYIRQITNDVTSELTASAELERTQTQLQEALEIGQVGSWVWDIAQDTVFADKNLCQLFGVAAGDGAHGLPLSVFVNSIYEEDRSRVRAAIDDSLHHNRPFEQEYRTVAPGRDMRWVIARGRIEAGPDGQAVSFPGVIVDITERKRSELNLRLLANVSRVLVASRSRQAALSNLAEAVVAEAGADWCMIDMMVGNQVEPVAVAHRDPKQLAWARQLRQAAPIDLSQPGGTADALRSGRARHYPVISDDMLQTAARDAAALQLMRKLAFKSVMLVPIMSGERAIGVITFVSSERQRTYSEADFAVAQDIGRRTELALANLELLHTTRQELRLRTHLETELREANERLEQRVRERTAQLEQLNENLKRSNLELQDFAYVASHDLQEPLRKIQAFSNLLESEYAGTLGDGADYLARMRGAASRMSSLIEDLLSFSRVTTKARPYEPVDLNEIVRGVLDDLETRVSDSGARLDVGQLPTVMADPLQMRQLLQNLLGNALKFTRPGVRPVVRVRAEAKPANHATIQTYELSVSDNGIGFDEKYLDRIFAVFQRLHGRDNYQGTGIGLAICRKIVERHGGTITARSRPGHGARFIVSLPARMKATTIKTAEGDAV